MGQACSFYGMRPPLCRCVSRQSEIWVHNIAESKVEQHTCRREKLERPKLFLDQSLISKMSYATMVSILTRTAAENTKDGTARPR